MHRATQLVQHLATGAGANSASLLPNQTNGKAKSPLDAERKTASFPIRQMTYFLDGGEEVTQVREMVAQSIAEDPVFIDPHRYDMTRPEARRRTMAKIQQVVGVIRAKNMGGEDIDPKNKETASSAEDKSSSRAGIGRTFEDAFYGTLASLDSSWAIRIGVHYGLFQGAINGQANDEQRKKWEKDIQEMNIIGCFGMTELGHGSYLQGLETTATYDKTTKEFIVNSPTVTSTKWWIGMAGQTATHCAVYARLIIDGHDHGLHCFVVPIRDLITGEPVANVSVGDMGAKMGRNGLDNGWIQFHNKRIPLDNMLMRWAQVSPDGKYTPAAYKQLTYNALIGTRVDLFSACSEAIKKAVTIATRYGAVRKQSPNVDNPDNGEQQLLGYQTHQYRLFPLIADVFALHFTARVMTHETEALMKDLEKNVDILPALHATSSGLKSFGTWLANDAIEVCRQCLGGAGYSSYTGLASMRADWAVMCTWEGDNTVLALQAARFLIKQYEAAKSGQQQSGFLAYLNSPPTKKCTATAPEHFFNAATLLDAYRSRAYAKISSTAQLIATSMKSGMNGTQAANAAAVDLCNAAKYHCYYYMLHCFVSGISKAPAELKSTLETLCYLFGTYHMEECMGEFLECTYLTPSHASLVRAAVRQLLLRVRPDAIPLVDSFNIPDFVLDSPLGRYDGDVYNHFFEAVKNAPGCQGIPDYFQEHIRPLTDKKYAATLQQ